MNTPDTQKPVMSLEQLQRKAEVWMRGSQLLSQAVAIPHDLSSDSLKQGVRLLHAALHHLNGGEEALKLANDAMNTCMDRCLENGHVFSQSYDSTKIGTAHIAVRAVLRSLNQVEIHNEITSS